MKIFSKILTIVGMSTAFATLPAESINIIENSPQQNTSSAKPRQVKQVRSNSQAVQVIAPQDGLEAAIRNSEQGDILLLGPDGWYRIEAKTLAKGTKMFVLSAPGSEVSAFPKERAPTR